MRQAQKSLKEKLGYDRDPPSCRDCVNFGQHPNTRSVMPNYCTLGRFYTISRACCDAWKGRNGDILE